MHVAINEANAHEYKRMSKVFYQSPAVSHPVDESVLDRNIDKIIKSDECDGYLLRYNDKTIGYTLISYMYSTETGMRDAWLEELYVSDDFRGNGLGTKVLETLIEELRLSCGRIRLEVTAVNKGAIALYQKHGFAFSPYEQMVLDL